MTEEESKNHECKPRLFFSHSWKHDKHYHNLKCKLDCADFQYYNHSIPKEKKLDASNEEEIRKGIESKIKGCSSVVVPAHMYANNFWIREEINMAKKMGKRIYAVKPRGAKRIPKYLREDKSVTVIGSNASSLINSVSCSF